MTLDASSPHTLLAAYMLNNWPLSNVVNPQGVHRPSQQSRYFVSTPRTDTKANARHKDSTEFLDSFDPKFLWHV
jgi:hypothetical protein